MNVYLDLGHGFERSGPRSTIPDGSVLVLSEECGMLGTVPWTYYELLANPVNVALLADPVTHRDAIEKLLGRRLRIYEAGERYPDLYLSPVSSVTGKTNQFTPSGVYRLPLPLADITYNANATASRRYTTSDVGLSFSGSIWGSPTSSSVAMGDLLTALPGVHYNFLCRSLDDDDVEALFYKTFPKARNEIDSEGFDPYRAIALWLDAHKADGTWTNEQKAVAGDLRARIATVEQRRATSGSPLESPALDRLLILLSSYEPAPVEMLDAAIAEVGNVNQASRHGLTPLIMAAWRGNLVGVARLLAAGADPNMRDPEDGTVPLHAAVTEIGEENPAIVRVLLKAGANVNARDHEGLTPLAMAVTSDSEEALAVVSLLIAAGADPSLGNALHQTADVEGHEDIVTVLLAAGANPNAKNERGATPLIVAARAGLPLTVTALLGGDADPNLRDNDNVNALGAAITNKHESVALQLLAAGVTVRDWRVLEKAARAKKLMQVAALARDKHGPSPSSSSSSSSKRTTRRRSNKK